MVRFFGPLCTIQCFALSGVRERHNNGSSDIIKLEDLDR